MQRRQMRLLSRYVSNGNRRRLTVRSPQQATALVWHEVVADGPDPHGESRRRHASATAPASKIAWERGNPFERAREDCWTAT